MLRRLFLFFCITFLFGGSFCYAEDSDNSGNITTTEFQITVSDVAPGGKFVKTGFNTGFNTEQVANFVLGTIIQKLMIGLGMCALFIMTLGAGYMIFAHGEDEFLSKGKAVFVSGITALVIALSSYYLVSFVRFILYSVDS